MIVNQWAGYLFVDIANLATERYEEVVLLAGKVSELTTPLSDSVRESWMPAYWRRSLFVRMISWITGFFWTVIVLKTKYRNHDVLLSTNPPLATWVPLFVRNPTSLFVLDLYPEALQMTGMLSERSPFYRVWRQLNAWSYPKYQNIFCLTNGMKVALEEYRSSVDIIPPWAASVGVTDKDSAQRFLLDHGLQGKFLVLYSGNLGKEHKIEVLVDAAEKLVANNKVHIVIVGGGWKYEQIASHIKARNLKNISMLPFQPTKGYQAILAASHLGVVAQSSRTASVCIPSKTFNLLAAGKPVVAIGSLHSDLADILHRYRCGQVFLEDEGVALAEYIEDIAADAQKLEELSAKATLAAQDFTSENASMIVEQVFHSHA